MGDDGTGAEARSVEAYARLLEAIVEHIPHMIFVKDASELRFVLFNRAGEELIGHDRAQLLGKSDFDLFPEDEAAFFVAKDREVLAGDSVFDIAEEPIHTRQRGTRLLHTKKVPVRGDDGELLYLLGISEDITDKKAADETLAETRNALTAAQAREAQKLEQLGTLAGGIAHDFNNLLVGILGNATLALRHLDEDARARPLVEMIEAAGRQAAELTKQILAYSGRGHFLLDEVDLAELVRSFAPLARASLPKSVQLDIDVTPGCVARVDAGQFRQLLMNLVVNAGDAYEGRRGTVSVRVGRTRADAVQPPTTPWELETIAAGEAVVLEVRDRGVGMDEPTLRQMFDPFFTTKASGHGLGLAATTGIVRGHRAALRVASTPGEGTVVRVVLPSACAEAKSGVARRPTRGDARSTDLAGLRVLVVDDEQAVRAFVCATLAEAGCTVDVASDGAIALERHRANPGEYDLIVLDLSMPGVSGIECHRALRAMGSGVPVILSSGFHAAEGASTLDAHTRFLQKPYAPSALVDMVRAMLRAGERDASRATAG